MALHTSLQWLAATSAALCDASVVLILGPCSIAAAVESAVCIVTGASRGIGRAIALALGQAGCKVGSWGSSQRDVGDWLAVAREHVSCQLEPHHSLPAAAADAYLLHH